jgi:hypothetical protein
MLLSDSSPPSMQNKLSSQSPFIEDSIEETLSIMATLAVRMLEQVSSDGNRIYQQITFRDYLPRRTVFYKLSEDKVQTIADIINYIS